MNLISGFDLEYNHNFAFIGTHYQQCKSAS